MKNPMIRLDPADNVVVARRDTPAGTAVPSEGITLASDVPAGYKVASRAIKQGEPIRKYNAVIGFAAEDVAPGAMMHSHNIRFDRLDLDYAFGADCHPVALLPPEQRAVFQGIVRPDGRVATRNYIGVLIVSNCAATVARRICDRFTAEVMAAYPNIDGVVPFVTELGCGMEMTGEPMDLLRRTIAGFIRNPNMGGAVVVALGCERNNIDEFFAQQKLAPGPLLHRLVMQEVGGTRASIDIGVEMVREMLPLVNDVRREPVSAEHLCLALECGGSDGFSGVSANPALGRAVDLLVKQGGTAILSETPEIFGAQHILTRRAVSPEVGQKLIDRIDWWLEYTGGRDSQINGRVSPGNNKGGIANILEKALGGVKKSGSTPLVEVYRYAEPVLARGVVFMDTPGYDPIACTGQIAGGANMMCFTTGRGSCYGSVPTPVIKLASNTPMYRFMQGDMDINCGAVVDGEKDLDEMGREIFEKILAVASGERSKSEELGIGESEYAPWPIGVFA
jgi:altronate hydrolase